MKTGQNLFNAIAILVAGLILFAGLVSLADSVRSQFPRHGANFWFAFFMTSCALALLIGGGGLANFANRKFTPGPTVVVILGYSLSVFLLPLAVWGIVLLVQERKHHHHHRRSHFD